MIKKLKNWARQILKKTAEVKQKIGEFERGKKKVVESAEERIDWIIKKQIEFDTDDRSKIVDSIRIAMSDPNLDAKIFEKKIDEGLNFVVLKSAKRFGGGIGFLIEKNGNREAQITFTPEKDRLNMTHREVHSQKFGISGGTLLKTIEEYFRVLTKEAIIPPELKYFSIEAGQVKVIEWVLKNGYQFEKESDAKLFEEIVSGKKNNDYIIADLTKGKLFANFIFEKEVYNQNYEEIAKKPSDARKYSVMFKLKKEIPSVTN